MWVPFIEGRTAVRMSGMIYLAFIERPPPINLDRRCFQCKGTTADLAKG